MAENNIASYDLATTINDTDLLVVAQHDRFRANSYDSRSIQNKTFMDVLVARSVELRQFNNTAFVDKNAFSSYDHNHDTLYNKVTVDHYFNKTSEDDDSVLSIGNLFINGSLDPIYVPVSAMTNIKDISFSVIEPRVGMLKFVASTSIQTNSTIAYRSDDFDGWLYPDGSTFNLNEFALSADIDALYGNRDGKTFTLPDIRKFIKLNGRRNNSENIIAETPYHNIVVSHSHDVNILADISYKLWCRIPCNNSPVCVDNTAVKPLKGSGRLKGGNGQICWTFADLTLTMSKAEAQPIIQKLRDYGIIKHASVSYIGLSRDQRYILDNIIINPNINDVENALKENDIELYQRFIDHDTIPVSTIASLIIHSNVSLNSSITIKENENGLDEETCPSHIILPVMIYVGQKKRDIK